jgi:hypothetical protein
MHLDLSATLNLIWGAHAPQTAEPSKLSAFVSSRALSFCASGLTRFEKLSQT